MNKKNLTLADLIRIMNSEIKEWEWNIAPYLVLDIESIAEYSNCESFELYWVVYSNLTLIELVKPTVDFGNFKKIFRISYNGKSYSIRSIS